MEKKLLVQQGQNMFPAGISMPFKKECITEVCLHYYKTLGEFKWHGTIEFKRGNTTAEQAFENKDLIHMLYEMQTFIDSL